MLEVWDQQLIGPSVTNCCITTRIVGCWWWWRFWKYLLFCCNCK